MTLRLPEVMASAVEPLLQALPLERAMGALVVENGADKALVKMVEAIVADPVFAARPALVAGLWLYIDELDRSHTVSQGIEDATGAFWHGIMHRREADFSNSHYWFRRVGKHPAMKAIQGYDGHAFIDAVEAGYRGAPAHLVQMQREEWRGLFSWCAGADSGNA